MQDGKWIDLDLRRPGTRRILEALREIEEEASGLIDEAALSFALAGVDDLIEEIRAARFVRAAA